VSLNGGPSEPRRWSDEYGPDIGGSPRVADQTTNVAARFS
jgi:hypothetical protein